MKTFFTWVGIQLLKIGLLKAQKLLERYDDDSVYKDSARRRFEKKKNIATHKTN